LPPAQPPPNIRLFGGGVFISSPNNEIYSHHAEMSISIEQD
jgi:hypothetical protein